MYLKANTHPEKTWTASFLAHLPKELRTMARLCGENPYCRSKLEVLHGGLQMDGIEAVDYR